MDWYEEQTELGRLAYLESIELVDEEPQRGDQGGYGESDEDSEREGEDYHDSEEEQGQMSDESDQSETSARSRSGSSERHFSPPETDYSDELFSRHSPSPPASYQVTRDSSPDLTTPDPTTTPTRPTTPPKPTELEFGPRQETSPQQRLELANSITSLSFYTPSPSTFTIDLPSASPSPQSSTPPPSTPVMPVVTPPLTPHKHMRVASASDETTPTKRVKTTGSVARSARVRTTTTVAEGQLPGTSIDRVLYHGRIIDVPSAPSSDPPPTPSPHHMLATAAGFLLGAGMMYSFMAA